MPRNDIPPEQGTGYVQLRRSQMLGIHYTPGNQSRLGN